MGYKMTDLGNNSLYERVNKLLVSYEWSDCSFSVHEKKFKAHKLILGISSPVFEAMFYGPLSTDDVITITDIEPHIFQLLINYIYTDKVEIHSIEDAYDLLYVSRKYMLEYLTEICVSYIQSNMNMDNVLTVLNYPDHMQDKPLILRAQRIFCQHADYLLKEHKDCIAATSMQKILKCNDMNVLEKDLIKNVFQWTSSYCEQNEITNNFQNRRDVLIKYGLLKLMRFFTLSVSELEEITACEYNLLLGYEEEYIKQGIKNPDSINNIDINITDIKSLPRKPLILQWRLCHRMPIRSESPLIIDPTNYTVYTKVKASKSTFIKSLNVQSRMAPVINYCNNLTNIYYEHFTISIICDADDSIVKRVDFRDQIEYDSNIDIEFDEPLIFKKESWYLISFVWPQLNDFYTYLYGVQRRDPCYNSGKIKFEFNDFLSFSDNEGSFLRGLKFSIN